jgi:hypothetical protein
MKYFVFIDLVIVLMVDFCFPRLGCRLGGRFSCSHRLGYRLMESSASMDLVVILWKVSVPMDLIVVLRRNSFFFFVTIDLIVVLWVCMYMFCHRLDCCLMVVFVSMDLVVALWRISAPVDLVVVLWKNFCSHGLGCCPMEEFLFPWTWLSS